MTRADLREQIKDLGIDAFLFTDPINIRYLSGFTGTSSMVLMTVKKQYLLVDSRYLTEAKTLINDYEIVPIQGSRTLYNLLLINGVRQLGFESLHLTFDQYDFMDEHYGGVKLIPIKHLIMAHRRIKTSKEMETIRIAAQIAESVFEEILNFIKIGQSERAISHEIERLMRSRGAENASFKTIVASGARSALPHGVASDKIIEDGDFLTLDYGCIYNGYCSDITRTVVVGSASEKQRRLYDLVWQSQAKTIAAIKPELECARLDAIARDFFKEKGYGAYFSHGLGHGIGLEVHEFPRITEDSFDVIKSGMALALEPGVYIEHYGGVRIEDMVLVTVDGYERLTKAPEHLIEI
ncbi:Xaa-Pro peptidase family protein [Fusibacter sp. 3D3]|uniref:M24 family metallopeptidase n=1 Tax=Fusibacter sp. 3D3 TaxID=1048380 RepID=UPI000852F61B|nr:Xaa-Pro peptidase family protein [Fusibacter sp. 3D3]GAU76959.1 aminopeptidase YpdF [Fusibacter sp. 3D3]